MPEIAEVRVVAKALRKQIVGKRIKNVKILYPNIVSSDKKEFVDTLVGLKYTGLDTYGKWLIFKLGDYSVLSHLRMEGKYYYVSHEKPLEKHTHVVFELEDGTELRYNDVRKFGRMELVKTAEIMDNKNIRKLGLEPDDEKLTCEYLEKKFKGNKKTIKAALLDQTIINGLGNIYANEVLFASKISPMRLAKDVTYEEMKNIISSAKSMILKSVEVGGCTIRSYTSSLGVIGHYQDYLKVHGKEGEPCPVCKEPIKKVQLDGRGTYFCDKCQK